jgi:hypothetical protein
MLSGRRPRVISVRFAPVLCVPRAPSPPPRPQALSHPIQTFVDKDVGYLPVAVNGVGTSILKSTDGGYTWSDDETAVSSSYANMEKQQLSLTPLSPYRHPFPSSS